MFLRAHQLLGVCALLLGACAAPPSSIAPAPVSEAQYRGWNCQRLAAEHAQLNHRLARLYSEQSQSRTDDVLGYVLLWRPVATLGGGDMRHQIALHKGEQIVIEDLIARDCRRVR